MRSGLRWTTVSLLALNVVRFVTMVVLTAILTEEDYGLATMAMAFVLSFQALRDIGLGPAYVNRKDLAPAEERLYQSTMFWIVLAMNGAMFTAGWFLAPMAADFFPKLDGLEGVLRGIFGLLLIEAFSTTPTAILQKRLQFSRIAAGEMVGMALYAAFSIGYALGGLGAWAIVLGTLSSRLCQTLYVLRLAAWSPRFEFSRGAAANLFGFGRYLWGNSLLIASTKVVDKFVLGKLLGDVVLGRYGVAYNLCTTASKPIWSIILRVTFPTLSKIRDDRAAVRAAVVAAITNVGLLVVPLAVGLALVAPDFVRVVYEPKWWSIVPLVRVLAFFGLVMSLAAITAPVMMALGRVKQLFHFALFGQALMFGLFAALHSRGAIGIASALVASVSIAETAAFLYLARTIELSLRSVAVPLARIAAATGLMALAVVGVRAGLGDASELVRLLAAVLAGVVSYGAAQFVTNRERFLESARGLRDVAGTRRART